LRTVSYEKKALRGVEHQALYSTAPTCKYYGASHWPNESFVHGEQKIV